MQPKVLAKKCLDVIAWRVAHGLPTVDATILVTTPQGWPRPKGFPPGHIVQWKPDGTRVRYLPAVRVLEWLVKNGFISVKDTEA